MRNPCDHHHDDRSPRINDDHDNVTSLDDHRRPRIHDDYLNECARIDHDAAKHFSACDKRACQRCDDLAARYLNLVRTVIYNGDEPPDIIDD